MITRFNKHHIDDEMDIIKALEQIKVACELGISSGEKIEPKDMLISINYILEIAKGCQHEPLVSLQAAELGETDIKQIGNISLCCMKKEARNLLDTIMEEWNKHYAELKKNNKPDYKPSYYGFAYWLVRYSGLIKANDSRLST